MMRAGLERDAEHRAAGARAPASLQRDRTLGVRCRHSARGSLRRPPDSVGNDDRADQVGFGAVCPHPRSAARPRTPHVELIGTAGARRLLRRRPFSLTRYQARRRSERAVHARVAGLACCENELKVRNGRARAGDLTPPSNTSLKSGQVDRQVEEQILVRLERLADSVTARAVAIRSCRWMPPIADRLALHRAGHRPSTGRTCPGRCRRQGRT